MGRTFAHGAAALALALALAACTTTTVTPLQVQRSANPVAAVEVGDVQVADPVWQSEIAHFQHGFVTRLQDKNVLQSAQGAAGTAPPPNTVVLTGKITTVDKGSRVERILIGFGLGAAHIEGQFQIVDGQGAVLAQFTNAKSYAGGAGIGGADFLDIDDLMEKFGADTADAVVAWSKGEMLPAAQYGH